MAVFVVGLGTLRVDKTALLAAFAINMLGLGLFLSTAFRTTEVGWFPAVFLLVGIWVPLMNEVRAAGGSSYSAWTRWSTSVLVPVAALNLGFRSIASVIAISATAALVWGVLTALLVRRPGMLDGTRD